MALPPTASQPFRLSMLINDRRYRSLTIQTVVFILVMPPCFASLATIRAEAGNRWMLFQVGYSLTLAWVLAFLVRAAGGLLTV
jgi:Fe2+ transport system protein B